MLHPETATSVRGRRGSKQGVDANARASARVARSSLRSIKYGSASSLRGSGDHARHEPMPAVVVRVILWATVAHLGRAESLG